MKLVLAKRFRRDLEKFLKSRPQLKPKVSKSLKFLQNNINHPSLRLHKLSGTNNWSISVTQDIRIIIHWERETIYLLRIGTHDEVY